MGKRYRLSWRTFEGPVKAIIHFYCEHPDITEAEMSAASFSAWCAVDSAMDQLSQEERDIIMERFTRTDEWMEGRPSIELINAIIRKTCRLTAEAMGICDKDTK